MVFWNFSSESGVYLDNVHDYRKFYFYGEMCLFPAVICSQGSHVQSHALSKTNCNKFYDKFIVKGDAKKVDMDFTK